MIPRILLDTAEIPGGGTLRLIRRGTEYSIMLGTNELMNSRVSGSEEALATLTCARLASPQNARLLIGGLGMGFTLRAALAVLPPEAEVVVAELVPGVIAWARGEMAQVFGDSLTDPRVTIQEGDVGDLIRSKPAAWDAILLDVDNGPDGLTRLENDRLYHANGLAAAHAALRSKGVLAVWSSARDDRFTARLRRAGFEVEENSVRSRGTSGAARHTIWLAVKQ
jgi:spermidine synthase